MTKTNRLFDQVNRLLAEGKVVLKQTRSGGREDVVDPILFTKWLMGCRNLLRMLGSCASAWEECFMQKVDYHEASRAHAMYSTLQAIKEAIENYLLVDIKNIVMADTFNDLLEQAEYLASEKYFVAAGVLARAVLEEHLRNWCSNTNCTLSKAKPTLADFNTALYKSHEYDVNVMKHIESMTATGNDAAHNKPELCSDDVIRLLRDVKEFLGKYTSI